MHHRRPLYVELAEYFNVTLTNAEKMHERATLMVIKKALDEGKLKIDQIYPDEKDRIRFFEGNVNLVEFIRDIIDTRHLAMVRAAGDLADQRIAERTAELEEGSEWLRQRLERNFNDRVYTELMPIQQELEEARDHNRGLRRQRRWLGGGIAATIAQA